MKSGIATSLSFLFSVLAANASWACITSAVDAEWTVDGRVLLFPSASDSLRQGFVRVINRSDREGEVRIHPVDDTGRKFDVLTLAIDANATAHFNSNDLEAGNRGKGLAGATGPGEGYWRLEFSSDLAIEVLSYVRTRDRLLTSMHDVAPCVGNLHRVVIFNPGNNSDQVSRLRLVNVGDAPASVAIEGMDDRGESPGSAVELSIPAGAARELGAADLETGLGVAGALGEGSGKWHLAVESVEPLLVMSLLESPMGHLTNLSTGALRQDPFLVVDNFVDTKLGNANGIEVSVVDGEGFEPGTHGQRVTDIFLANTTAASLTQFDGWGEYRYLGESISGVNSSGYVRHALRSGGGVFWSATDDSPAYQRTTRNQWFMAGGRPFFRHVRTFARWARHQNVLFVSSLENTHGKPSDAGGYDPVYCDDFGLNAEDYWIPLCGAVDDYAAHSGVGIERIVFVGAIDRFGNGNAAIRADGVFAPHTIYVESPDGSTSQATPVLAAYATNLAFANPKWGAATLKRELMALAREETIDHHTGGSNASGTGIFERRTIKVIRPELAPTGAFR